MDEASIRQKLNDILASLPEVSLVYLFGSQVEGQPGPMSDYDLGILLDRQADHATLRARFSLELARALGTDRIDVVLLDRVPVELAYAIIARGQVLYQRDLATRVEFEALVMTRYGDYLPVLRALRRDILQGDKDGARVQRYREALGRTERTLSQIAPHENQGEN